MGTASGSLPFISGWHFRSMQHPSMYTVSVSLQSSASLLQTSEFRNIYSHPSHRHLPLRSNSDSTPTIAGLPCAAPELPWRLNVGSGFVCVDVSLGQSSTRIGIPVDFRVLSLFLVRLKDF